MSKDERDLLDALKFELDFLQKDGYARPVREPWRCQLIFEDSPTCANHDSKDECKPCHQCALMPLVPQGSRDEKIPCRHIPLNTQGETLDSLYRYADQRETEEVFGNWLRSTIAKLETESTARARRPSPLSRRDRR
jgi:hypothetical protein